MSQIGLFGLVTARSRSLEIAPFDRAASDRRIDSQHDDSIYRASIAMRG